MRRRYGKTKLSVRTEQAEDVNPMESVANLVDAMLVLACGLMLALIINWNVDVGSGGSLKEMTQGQEVSELGGSNSGDTSTLEGDYEEMGMVYRDPETGKYYLVQTPQDSSEGSGDGATTEAGDGSEE